MDFVEKTTVLVQCCVVHITNDCCPYDSGVHLNQLVPDRLYCRYCKKVQLLYIFAIQDNESAGCSQNSFSATQFLLKVIHL